MAGEDREASLAATLAHLAVPDRGILIHFGCRKSVPVALEGGFSELHTLKHHYGWTLPAGEALALWGAATTLYQLEGRARCCVCGARGQPYVSVSLHVPTSR